MEANHNTERRQKAQRRHADAGPPQGIAERRINIERRLFNIDFGQAGSRSGAYAADKSPGLPG